MNKWHILVPIGLWLLVDLVQLYLFFFVGDQLSFGQDLLIIFPLKCWAWVFTIRAIWIFFTKTR